MSAAPGGTAIAGAPSRRADWHQRVGLVPMGYLAAVVAVALAHSVVPRAPWLLIHLLLLGAATNAILIWGALVPAARILLSRAR